MRRPGALEEKPSHFAQGLVYCRQLFTSRALWAVGSLLIVGSLGGFMLYKHSLSARLLNNTPPVASDRLTVQDTTETNVVDNVEPTEPVTAATADTTPAGQTDSAATDTGATAPTTTIASVTLPTCDEKAKQKILQKYTDGINDLLGSIITLLPIQDTPEYIAGQKELARIRDNKLAHVHCL